MEEFKQSEVLESGMPVGVGAQGDHARVRALRWKQDLRIIPLGAFIYFLCSLDRGNIGNAKILNSTSGDDLLQLTHMTDHQYVISLMIFLRTAS